LELSTRLPVSAMWVNVVTRCIVLSVEFGFSNIIGNATIMLAADTVRYQPVADNVSAKLHHLLGLLVVVVNHEELVIASSQKSQVGMLAEQLFTSDDNSLVRVPIPFDCDRLAGEVVIQQPEGFSPTSERLTRALAEMVINEVIVRNWLPAQADIKNKFIYDTLHGRITDPEVLQREAQILGMDLSQPRSIILINARDYVYPHDRDGLLSGESAQLRAQQRARFVISSIVSFFELPDDTICAYIGDGEIVVLKSISRQTLRPWSADGDDAPSTGSWVDLHALRRAATGLLKRLRNDSRASISIGIGRYHSGVDGLARSYNDARIALTVGTRYHGEDRVHSIDDLGLAAFVGGADERTKRDLAAHLLNPLQQEPDLLETLSAYMEEGCCPSLAVARLAIHRNTLGHRLQKISTLVGLDPRKFDDAIQLRLAMLVLSLPVR
jgi:carbohydrate diacid regulator